MQSFNKYSVCAFRVHPVWNDISSIVKGDIEYNTSFELEYDLYVFVDGFFWQLVLFMFDNCMDNWCFGQFNHWMQWIPKSFIFSISSWFGDFGVARHRPINGFVSKFRASTQCEVAFKTFIYSLSSWTHRDLSPIFYLNFDLMNFNKLS